MVSQKMCGFYWATLYIPLLKTVLLMIRDELTQEAIRKSIVSFRKRLRTCINAKGGHFEYKLK